MAYQRRHPTFSSWINQKRFWYIKETNPGLGGGCYDYEANFNAFMYCSFMAVNAALYYTSCFPFVTFVLGTVTFLLGMVVVFNNDYQKQHMRYNERMEFDQYRWLIKRYTYVDMLYFLSHCTQLVAFGTAMLYNMNHFIDSFPVCLELLKALTSGYILVDMCEWHWIHEQSLKNNPNICWRVLKS